MSVDDIRLRHREIIVPDLWTVHSDLLGQCIKDVRELLAEVAWLETPMRARHKALIERHKALLARHKALLAAAKESPWSVDWADATEEERARERLEEAIEACERDGPK